MKYENTSTGDIYPNVEAVYDNTSCTEYYDVIMACSAGTLKEIK